MNFCLVVFLLVAGLTAVHCNGGVCPKRFPILKPGGCGSCRGRHEHCVGGRVCCTKVRGRPKCPMGYNEVSPRNCDKKSCTYIRHKGACCKPGACQDVAAVANGRIIYSHESTAPHPSGTIAIVVCDYFSKMSGSATITCKAGQWDNAPTCVSSLDPRCHTYNQAITGRTCRIRKIYKAIPICFCEP